jgi:anti-sigma factor RsiW
MDSHDGHDQLLTAFLAGDLGPADAQRWDEHLLECERCWRAVREDRAGRQAAQLLRQPVPPGLADRVAFAVEVAAAARTAAPRRGLRSRQRGRQGRRLRWRLTGAAAVAAGLVATLMVVLLPGGHQTGSVPAAVAAVARYAQAIPAPAPGQHAHLDRAAPVEVGRPVTATADGQRIVVRTWRLGGVEAVVAVSRRPFPMPARAQAVPSQGMAWSARLGRLGLYCLNGRTSELVAAPVPAAELAALAARLPPA